MKKQNNLSKTIISLSFAIYLLLLTWIIVFKFHLDITSLKYIRSINLIPFKANPIVNGMRETLINLLLFVPLGMYLKFIFKNNKFSSVSIIILLTIGFEILQYILHIGVSDITDIIMNTLGGIIGIILISVFFNLLSKETNSKILNRLLELLLIIIPILMFVSLYFI